MREISRIMLSRELTESFGHLPALCADMLRHWSEHNLVLETPNPTYCQFHEGRVYIKLTNRFLSSYLFCTHSAASKACTKLVKHGVFIEGPEDHFGHKKKAGTWYAFNLTLVKKLPGFFDAGIQKRLRSIRLSYLKSLRVSNGNTNENEAKPVVPAEPPSVSSGNAGSVSNGNTSIHIKGLTKDKPTTRAREDAATINLRFLNADELADYAPHVRHIVDEFGDYDPLALIRSSWQYLTRELGLGRRRATLSSSDVLELFAEHGRDRLIACLVAIAYNGTGNASRSAIRGFMANLGRQKLKPGEKALKPKPRPQQSPVRPAPLPAPRKGTATPVKDLLGKSFLTGEVKDLAQTFGPIAVNATGDHTSSPPPNH